jgi:transposase-like protein
LVAAVAPDTNVILHVKFYPSRNTAVTKMFLRELQDKHAIDETEFLVDGAPLAACRVVRTRDAFATKHTAIVTPSNVSFKK